VCREGPSRQKVAVWSSTKNPSPSSSRSSTEVSRRWPCNSQLKHGVDFLGQFQGMVHEAQMAGRYRPAGWLRNGTRHTGVGLRVGASLGAAGHGTKRCQQGHSADDSYRVSVPQPRDVQDGAGGKGDGCENIGGVVDSKVEP